jgi:predicted dehydrogenase
MKKRKLNVAMIGYGFMGRAHSNAFRQAGSFFDLPVELKLKTVCGRNRSQLEEMAGAWGWAETATDWEAVIRRPDIDVVDICTPNYLHAPIAIAAAQAGKIVLCEKPLASSVEEAKSMTEAARKVPTLVWFNYRRVPAVSLAKQLIAQGQVGEVYHYRAVYLQSWGKDPANPDAWRFDPVEAGSGVMGDLLSHSLDLAIWLNGPVRRLFAHLHTFAKGRRVDDAVTVLAEFTNGSIGTFEASRFATGNLNRNSFEINGSLGALQFNLEEMNHLAFNDLRDDAAEQGWRKMLVTGPRHPYAEHFWPPGHILGYEHTFICTLIDFLFALDRRERFSPDFADALEVQRLMKAVTESSTSRCWIDVSPSATSNPQAGGPM